MNLKNQKKLKFSVIIPTRNRQHVLAKCLHSFTALDYPGDAWELILVNDGGAKTFSPITQKLAEKLPLRLVEIVHSGPAAARNTGARLAGGEYLAFTDDDCCVEPDWLHQFEKGFNNRHQDALGGKSLNPYPTSSIAKAWHSLIDFLYEYKKDRYNNALLLVSNNVAYRRPVFEALGGFNEIFPFAGGEDTELSCRLVNSGYRQCYYPSAKIFHYHQKTSLWGYICQQFRYGRGSAYIHKINSQTQAEPSIQHRLRDWFAFETSLLKYLWRIRAPFSIWMLIGISQVIAYPSGVFYQVVLRRFNQSS
jgi:cellulose synthase/poly-beta-1,6-N-acetylglucosamine synthase-like glycosyltransferase